MITADNIINYINVAKESSDDFVEYMDIETIFNDLIEQNDDVVIEILIDVFEVDGGSYVIDDLYTRYDSVNDNGEYDTIVKYLDKHLT